MLRLGRGSFDDDALLIMAIINRTPDSFYDKGATYEFDLALDRVRHVVAEGADLVDIGGVKAAPGTEVTVAEEIDRTVSLVAAIRSEFPELVVSVDTWRHEVGDAVCQEGRTSSTTRGVGGTRALRRWRRSTTQH
jgi:dihydropteroate synthase